jgi:hypothetical protein
MLVIDGLAVDDDALFGLAHDCTPTRYPGQCRCCGTYEVCVSAKELALLDGCVATAGATGILSKPLHSVFEKLDDGQYCLDTDEDGLCRLALPQSDGSAYCALHTSALQQELEPYTHKPRACSLWPLATTEGKDPVLGVTPDALEFPCNRKRRGTPRRLDKGIAVIVDALYGRDFRRGLEFARVERLLQSAP